MRRCQGQADGGFLVDEIFDEGIKSLSHCSCDFKICLKFNGALGLDPVMVHIDLDKQQWYENSEKKENEPALDTYKIFPVRNSEWCSCHILGPKGSLKPKSSNFYSIWHLQLYFCNKRQYRQSSIVEITGSMT